MKLTPDQKQKIKELAEQRGTNQKEAVMQLVDEALREKPVETTPGSVYARNKDLFGSGKGPYDLSTNPKYLEDYGR